MCRSIDLLHAPFRYPRYPQDPAKKARSGLISPGDPRRGRKVRLDRGFYGFCAENDRAAQKH